MMNVFLFLLNQVREGIRPYDIYWPLSLLTLIRQAHTLF